MKKILSIIALILVVVFLFVLKIKYNEKQDDFYLKYEYSDSWGGKIKQVIEINNLNYNYSLSIENHYELENVDEKNNGTLTEERQNNIKSLLKIDSNNWKKQNKKIKKFVNSATDMPYEHLIITNNGVNFELDYLPLSIKSSLEGVLGKTVYGDIEQTYNNSNH